MLFGLKRVCLVEHFLNLFIKASDNSIDLTDEVHFLHKFYIS